MASDLPTKAQTARTLPIGTWFAYPPPASKRHHYYRPKVYRVEPDRRISRPVWEEFGIWDSEGVNSPEQAYARAQAVAVTLNEQQADWDTAHAQLDAYSEQRVIATVKLPWTT